MMIRTIVMLTFITGLMAKNYLIETGDKEGGDQGDQGDYTLTGKIEMKEYGQVDDNTFDFLI